jgi:hypothetical protein
MSQPDPSYDPLDNLEHELERGPDAIKKALMAWRKATFERKKKEALLFAEFKGKAHIENKEITSTEIKHLTNSDPEYDSFVWREIEAEAEYKRVEEKHLGNKKRAAIRTAY